MLLCSVAGCKLAARSSAVVIPNGELGGSEPFVVRGKEHEMRVVTDRLARDVESNEECKG